MALIPPTASALKARYPELAAVPDSTVSAALSATPEDVDENWPPELQVPAMLALAAHWLVQGGALNPATSDAAIGNGAPVSELRAGDHSIKFATSAASGSGSSGGGGNASGFDRTLYGRRYLELLGRAFPVFIAVV